MDRGEARELGFGVLHVRDGEVGEEDGGGVGGEEEGREGALGVQVYAGGLEGEDGGEGGVELGLGEGGAGGCLGLGVG